MLCESDMFKDNLMWDPSYSSWRLMIAMVFQSKNTPPTFYHVTWKVDQNGKWKTLNSPPYTALFRDLRSRNPMPETLHIQLHGSDFAKLPLSAGLRWLTEFPPEWAWFLPWFPGQVPEHFKDHSRVPAQSSPSGSAPVSLPTPIAQPPMPSWQSACISNPILMAQLHEFLAQDVEQNQPAIEESSTLPQAVAQRMTPEQQASHIRDRTWHRSEMEKRRRMAQPGWKAAMEAQGTSLIQQQERVTQALLRSGQTPPTAPGMQPLTTIPDRPECADS